MILELCIKQMKIYIPNLRSRFVNADGLDIGPVFTKFLFQLSFATTATTIVSGGIAER